MALSGGENPDPAGDDVTPKGFYPRVAAPSIASTAREGPPVLMGIFGSTWSSAGRVVPRPSKGDSFRPEQTGSSITKACEQVTKAGGATPPLGPLGGNAPGNSKNAKNAKNTGKKETQREKKRRRRERKIMFFPIFLKILGGESSGRGGVDRSGYYSPRRV